MRHYEPVVKKAEPTLFEWAGGAEAFERLTETFYGKVMKDDLIGPLFAHMDPGHPRYVAMWLGEVFGGPTHYSQERGGHARMVSQHLGKGITEQQRRRWVSLLMDSADEVCQRHTRSGLGGVARGKFLDLYSATPSTGAGLVMA